MPMFMPAFMPMVRRCIHGGQDGQATTEGQWGEVFAGVSPSGVGAAAVSGATAAVVSGPAELGAGIRASLAGRRGAALRCVPSPAPEYMPSRRHIAQPGVAAPVSRLSQVGALAPQSERSQPISASCSRPPARLPASARPRQASRKRSSRFGLQPRPPGRDAPPTKRSYRCACPGTGAPTPPADHVVIKPGRR